MLEGKELFEGLVKSTYLSKLKNSPFRGFAKVLLYKKSLPVSSAEKLVGQKDVLYFDYERNLDIGEFVRLVPLSEVGNNPVIEAYFTGYEGISEKLGDVNVYSGFKKLFEKYYICFRNMVDAHGVKAILLTGLVGVYEAALLQLSLDENIPVFCCQHGLYLRLFPNKKLLKNVIFFASGAEERRILRDNDVPDMNIVVTGSPFFDGVAEFREIRRFLDRRLVKKERSRVVVLAQPLDDGEIDVAKYRVRLRGIADKYGPDNVVVKIHPRSKNVGIYSDMGFSINAGRTKKELYSLLVSASLVIGFESTAELEAMMLGVPVIVYDDVRRESLPYRYKKVPFSKQSYYIRRNFITDGHSQQRILEDIYRKL